MGDASGIKQFYGLKYDPKSDEFWKKIELPDGADEIYVCIGVKASNFFMPAETLSDKGPGWGDGTAFAIGDCNLGCIGAPPNFELPPIPKISYPGEEQALHAVKNLEALDAAKYGGPLC